MVKEMELKYRSINEDEYELFHELLEEYYRDGEDENTGKDIVDNFIKDMFNQVLNDDLRCNIIECENKVLGFVIYMIDEESKKYSELPGYGTFVEIGLKKEYRNLHLGEEIVDFTEHTMIKEGVTKFYITPYGKALNFWLRCGYKSSGKMGKNNMEIYTKTI